MLNKIKSAKPGKKKQQLFLGKCLHTILRTGKNEWAHTISLKGIPASWCSSRKCVTLLLVNLPVRWTHGTNRSTVERNGKLRVTASLSGGKIEPAYKYCICLLGLLRFVWKDGVAHIFENSKASTCLHVSISRYLRLGNDKTPCRTLDNRKLRMGAQVSKIFSWPMERRWAKMPEHMSAPENNLNLISGECGRRASPTL